MRLLPTTGRYELLKEIGHGTFATVYKALKVGTTEIFAVKRVDKRKLNEDDVAALRTEVSFAGAECFGAWLGGWVAG